MYIPSFQLDVYWHSVPPSDPTERASWFAAHGPKKGSFRVELTAPYENWLLVAATIREDGSLYVPEPTLVELRVWLAKLARSTPEVFDCEGIIPLVRDESIAVLENTRASLQAQIREWPLKHFATYEGLPTKPSTAQMLWEIVPADRKAEIEAYQKQAFAERERKIAERNEAEERAKQERARKLEEEAEVHRKTRAAMSVFLHSIQADFGDDTLVERFEAGVLPDKELDAILLGYVFGNEDDRLGGFQLDPYKKAEVLDEDKPDLSAEAFQHVKGMAQLAEEARSRYPFMEPRAEACAEVMTGYSSTASTLHLQVKVPHLLKANGSYPSYIAEEWVLLKDLEE